MNARTMPALSRAAAWSAWIVLSVLAGVVLGVAGRVAMRLVARASGLTGEFSAGGSLEVVLFGVFLGAPVALVYWGLRQALPLPSGTGAIVGLALFVVLAFWPPGPARSALEGTADSPPVTAAIFAAAFLLYGLALDLIWRARRS